MCDFPMAHACIKAAVRDQTQIHKSGKQTPLSGIRPAERENKINGKIREGKEDGREIRHKGRE